MKDVEPIHDQATDTPRRRRGGRASVGRGPGSRHGAPRPRRGRRAPAVAWVADPNGPHADEPTPARSARAAVIYWLVAGAIYIGLGIAYPPAFLLGFQEAIVFVLIVTALAPKVLGRFK